MDEKQDKHMSAARWKHLQRKLRELGFARYADYLQSPHWRVVKVTWQPRRRSSKGQPVCEFCASAGLLELHHRTYRNLGNERRSDLVLLCRDCHETVHIVHAKSKSRSLIRATLAVQRAVS